MKRTTLLLILGTICLTVYSQHHSVKERIIFTLPQNEMYVKLEEYRDRDDKNHDTALYVNCIVHCSEWKHTKIAEIFTEGTYNPNILLTAGDTLYRKIFPYDEGRTIDSLFQHLYNWIKEIENFATNSRVGDTVTMNYHNYYCCSTLDQHDYYLTVHPDYITISTSIYMRDQMGAFCVRWTKMKLKTITEFKKRLLDYTANHKISIKF
jgi:hypothetical protein